MIFYFPRYGTKNALYVRSILYFICAFRQQYFLFLIQILSCFFIMYTLRLSFIFLIIAIYIGNCEEQYCSIDNTVDCVKEKKVNIYKGNREQNV